MWACERVHKLVDLKRPVSNSALQAKTVTRLDGEPVFVCLTGHPL
jgi:hypothetical protein